MPGKHAPSSPASFTWSVARASAGALAVLGIVVAIAVVAVKSRGDEVALDRPGASSSPTTVKKSPAPSSASPAPTATATLRPRSKVTVVVLNGAGVAGLAARVSDRLDKDGYDVQTPGNVARTANTTIYYRRDARRDADALRRLRFDFVDAVQKATGDLPDDVLVIVVLGRDYPT